jgi:hypothetical protein
MADPLPPARHRPTYNNSQGYEPDYRELLIKYMSMMLDVEGTDYVDILYGIGRKKVHAGPTPLVLDIDHRDLSTLQQLHDIVEQRRTREMNRR